MNKKWAVHHVKCHNPNLGLATKARACKVLGQEGGPEITSHAPGSAKSVREWTLTLLSELPFRELESQWTSISSNGDCSGQNHWFEKFFISLKRYWILDV
jgi:hypothetical protein